MVRKGSGVQIPIVAPKRLLRPQIGVVFCIMSTMTLTSKLSYVALIVFAIFIVAVAMPALGAGGISVGGFAAGVLLATAIYGLIQKIPFKKLPQGLYFATLAIFTISAAYGAIVIFYGILFRNFTF